MKKNETNSLAENNLGLVHLCANRLETKELSMTIFTVQAA